MFNLFLTHEEFFNLILAHEELFNIFSTHQEFLNLLSAHQKRLNLTSTHQVLSNDIKWNASQLNNEIDDESLISNIESELLKDFFFSTFINQRDLQEANIENVNSTNIGKEHASLTFEYKKKHYFEISSCSIKKEMSDFCLAFELWYDTEEIKKNTYNNLFEMLHLLNSSEMRKLLRRLNTLHIWCKRRLSLSFIQKIVIAVKKLKQFTRIRKSDKSNIYFFDLRILIVTILSSTWTNVLHTNMTNIVNKSSEYWHLNAWDSFIRTCSQNYIRYLNDTSLISFDFVHYRCNDLECTMSYKDQMIFFDRDRKSNSTTIDKTLWKSNLWKSLMKWWDLINSSRFQDFRYQMTNCC